MKPLLRRVLPAWIAAGAIACASLGTPSAPSPEERLVDGLAALRAADYPTARATLREIAADHPGGQIGRRAILALAAVELDPRNPDRRLETGAQLAARYIETSPDDDWSGPLAETLYLLGHELASAEHAVAATRPDSAADDIVPMKGSAAPLRAAPPLPDTRLIVRLREREQERAALHERVRQLETELERIRKALKP